MVLGRLAAGVFAESAVRLGMVVFAYSLLIDRTALRIFSKKACLRISQCPRRQSYFFLQKKARFTGSYNQNTHMPASMVAECLDSPPRHLAFHWLIKEMERIDCEERNVVRFGTVYLKYGRTPNRPEAEKPRGHTYLTHARRLIPRRRFEKL